jgi:flagellar motor switch protein FliN/FliY
MGTSATTLSTLLGKKVNITTPHVKVAQSVLDFGNYKKPYVAVEVSYTSGVDGYNILLMKNEDVLIITDLLMGGSGEVDLTAELEELQLSAISEVMNQMVGSASTSLSTILLMPVNISPPRTKKIVLETEDIQDLVCGQDTTIAISFSMEIEGVLKSELLQIMPFDFGRKLAGVLLNDMMNAAPASTPAPPVSRAPVTPPPAPSPAPVREQRPQSPARPSVPSHVQRPTQEANRVSVKAMQYSSFDEPAQTSSFSDTEYNNSLNLILDVPLQVTVELGKSRKSIKDILALSTGSVIVLDKLAGEMVDVLVNGRLFARGEVVVIDDNYGVRVTEIISGSQVTGGRMKNNLFDA